MKCEFAVAQCEFAAAQCGVRHTGALIGWRRVAVAQVEWCEPLGCP